MAKYVVSTLTAPNRYAGWSKSGGVNMIERSVLVKGGAGIALKGIGAPRGVVTEISDADAEFLKQHEHFLAHQKGGFVRLLDRAPEPNKAAGSMEKDDGSRPRDEKDVEASNKKAGLDDKDEKTTVTTNAGKKK